MRRKLTTAIVCFHSNADKFRKTIESLHVASARAFCESKSRDCALTIVNNDGAANNLDLVVSTGWEDPHVISSQGNVGFGQGHNLAMQDMGEYHLILNPDVEIAPDALASALTFMEANPQCGLLAPKTFNGKGGREYLCKRYPSVLDIALRGFAPAWLASLFRSRLGHYEMRDVMNDEVVWDPPIISGCFMLFRSEVLEKVGGFDLDFFLYFEDFDLSLRTAAFARIAYVPDVKIVHHGGDAARKGLRHICLFSKSAITFFNKHGWRWF